MTEHTELSEREVEILQLLAGGLSNKEIATRLYISPNTVKVHLRNVFSKINVISRTEATLYAIEHGYVNNPAPPPAPAAPPQPVIDVLPAKPDFFRRFGWLLGVLALAIVVLVVVLRNPLLNPQPQPDGTDEVGVSVSRWLDLPNLPEWRVGMAAAVYEQTLYVTGGTGEQGISAALFAYDVKDKSWETLSDKPTAVKDAAAALLGEKIYIPGGVGADGKPTDVLEAYNPRTDAWETKASLPQALSGYALAVFEGRLYLFGGWDGTKALDSLWVYNPQTDAWQQGTALPTPRAYAAAAVVNGGIHLLGGYDGAALLNLHEVYMPTRDAAGETAWEVATPLPQPRAGMGASGLLDVIYVVGGKGEVPAQSLASYLFSDAQWVEFPALANSESCTQTAEGSVIYLLGTNAGVTELWAYQAVYSMYIPAIQ